MAVNTIGNKDIDSIVTGELCMDAMNFAIEELEKKGYFYIKVIHGI